MKRWTWSVVVAVAALSMSGCVMVRSMGVGVARVDRADTVVVNATATACGWGSLSHPVLLRVNERRLAVTYCVQGDGATSGPRADTDWPAWTEDDGLTWSLGDPFAWQAPPSNYTTRIRAGQSFAYNSGSFFGYVIQRDGLRVGQGFAVRRVGPGRYQTEGIFSRDGVTWSGAVMVNYQLDAARYTSPVLLSPRGVQLADRRTVVVGYTRPVQQKLYETLAFVSSDGGFNFSLLSVVATSADCPWGNEGPCEPGLALLPDGDLLCLMRTGATGEGVGLRGAMPMLQARSLDGGLTWTHTRLRQAGVMPKLLPMSNGLLACAFGRPGNSIMFSGDGGRQWGSLLTITPAASRTTGYIDIEEVAPGRLLAVFDEFNTSRQKIWLWEPPAEQNLLQATTLTVSPGWGAGNQYGETP
jgi:hypothetical protein